LGLCEVELRFKPVLGAHGLLGWHGFGIASDPNGTLVHVEDGDRVDLEDLLSEITAIAFEAVVVGCTE